MKFPWQQPDNRDQLIESYRKALEVYADSDNWSQVSCYGTLKPRRWKGGGDGADLARQTLQQAEDIAGRKSPKEKQL